MKIIIYILTSIEVLSLRSFNNEASTLMVNTETTVRCFNVEASLSPMCSMLHHGEATLFHNGMYVCVCVSVCVCLCVCVMTRRSHTTVCCGRNKLRAVQFGAEGPKLVGPKAPLMPSAGTSWKSRPQGGFSASIYICIYLYIYVYIYIIF